MTIAVVTPYYREPLEVLRQAHDSVRGQTADDVVHIMVADGHPRPEVDDWPVHHIRLPAAHGDNGNTPRGLGMKAAVEDLGAQTVAFLDADNWFEPTHIEQLSTALRDTGADVATSGRCIRALDGSVLLPRGETRDGQSHHDTSALMVTGPARLSWPLWLDMPRPLSPICDTVYWYGLLYAGCVFTHVDAPTLNFQSHYMNHYIRAWTEGQSTEPVLPSTPQRQAQSGRRTLDTYPKRDLATLYQTTLGALLTDVSPPQAMLRFGTALARLDITMDAVPVLSELDDLDGTLASIRQVNLATALARQSHWRKDLTETAERALRDAIRGPYAALAANNLAILFGLLGRIRDAVPLLETVDSTPLVLPEGYRQIPVGTTAYRVIGP